MKTELASAHSLTDAFGRIHTYLRIAVTDRCNLRCGYCMPEEGVPWRPHADILTYEEIVRVARVCAAQGVRKIRLTGGEPTVRLGIETLVAQLAAVPGIETLALTTNGVRLVELAGRLREAGISRLNISLDTLRPDRFAQITRRDEFPRVMTGIDAALAAGFPVVKLNVVLMAGVNDDELFDFVEFARARPINVRFIEQMPFPRNNWSTGSSVTAAAIKARLAERYALTAMPALDGQVATDFRLDGICGTISFITPLSEPFCDSCARLRLTADGSIKSCLFHPAEVNLRAALRDGSLDEQITALLLEALGRKPAGHPPAEEMARAAHRAMNDIGG